MLPLLLFFAMQTPDSTAQLQRMIDRCRPNGTVTLPPGIHSVSTLQLRPNCSYAGAPGGTTLVLRRKDAFLLEMSERSNIRIAGIDFDGNDLGGALLMRENGPVRGIHVSNCRFRNVSPSATYPANIAIYSSWAIMDSSFTNNRFTNVAAGIMTTTVQNVTISGNTFTDVTQGDAIFIAPNPVPFRSGDGLRITGNTGSGIAKMGVEIFRPDPPNGSRLVEPVIENNRFSRFTARNGEGMGLSITHGENAIVRDNVIDNSAGLHQENGIGIEIIVRGAQVDNNTVTGGFGYGIAVQGTAEAAITRNHLDGIRKDSILFACDSGRKRCDSSGSRVEGNVISGPGLTGIHMLNRSEGSQIRNNKISLPRGRGIRESVRMERSVVTGNAITQQAGNR